MQYKRTLLAAAIGATLTTPVGVSAAEDKSTELESVEIIGDQENSFTLGGSAHVLDEEDLEEKEYSDIHRIMREVPGVYFREEEGYGLRPNIGIRGSGSGRSSKISLMEDGILMAPAPYAAPSAYYFPTAGRMSGVEVLKGPETLRHGPFTVGGAVNLLSWPIPEDSEGMINMEIGEYGGQRGHFRYGATEGQWGYSLETHHNASNGFKDVDRSGRDTGFDQEDYVAKLRWSSAPEAEIKQSVQLKLQHSSEVSNMSYLGLTDDDFSEDPNRRYGLSALDQMDKDHDSVSLQHNIAFNEAWSLHSTIYQNEFARDWFKVASVEDYNNPGGDALGIGDLINRANNGDSMAQDILHGDASANDVRIKHNNREYEARGVQSELNGRFNLAGVEHELVAGARFHQDEVDRFQPVEIYDQQNGSLVRTGIDRPSDGDNRVEEADALSAWLVDRVYIDDVIVTGSLRYEDIETESRRWADPGRTNEMTGDATDNQVDDVLAGLGATWLLDENWSLLAGVHQGFAPPGGSAGKGVEPEESVNYETGVRYGSENLTAEAIAFYSDYQNTVQNCTVANPCPNNNTSGTQSNGESEIQGLEASLNSVVWQGGDLRAPVRLTYTYTDAEVTADADDGDVQEGDNLVYLPENLLSLTLGLEERGQWSTSLSASYTDEMCVDNTCDRSGVDDTFKRTDDYVVLDFAGTWHLTPEVELYGKVDNVLDDQEIVSRSPAGARPNKPRTAYIGTRLRF